MKTIDIYPAAPLCTEDKMLLQHFSEHLEDGRTPWRDRKAIFSIAAGFLQWKRMHVSDEYRLSPNDGARRHDTTAWMDLRETYLRHECPDHDLRVDRRTMLNRFLRFATGTRPQETIVA